MGYATLVAALSMVAVTLSTQVPTPSVVAFEVASVKINRSGLPGGFSQLHPGGRLTETNQTLRQIILDAYGIETFRLIGGPSWLGRDRFDIDGRAGHDAPREELLEMLRALLADRCTCRSSLTLPPVAIGGGAPALDHDPPPSQLQNLVVL